ncbi:MAG: hypothetical protein GOV00_03800 [Candidatus Altiarchaeota archaeon]|nr:hypothetical protein [Candidatus Altiarchaeota archaeon]
MKAWFDLMVFPLLLLTLSAFHWLTESLIYEIGSEKAVLENSRVAEDTANGLFFGNCTSTTHTLTEVPTPKGTYRVFRVALVKGSPTLIVIGNENG